ncbi:MAG: TylF/MycF/NovP-related O-methyltransferase [Ardenticatenales bacterium]
MSRPPCQHDPQRPAVPGCGGCYHWHHSPAYRRKWGGKVSARIVRLPCPFFGPPTGETRLCQVCNTKKLVDLHYCAKHGTCAPSNQVGADVKCCAICPDWPPAPLPPVPVADIVVDHGASGLGDSLLGLCAVARLMNDNPGKSLRYNLNQKWEAFLDLFAVDASYGPQAEAHVERAPSSTTARQMNDGYSRESEGQPRWERYAANIGAAGVTIPKLRNPEDLAAAAADYAGVVALCPFSTERAREWSLAHWLTLEKLLLAAGYRTLVCHKWADRTERFVGEKLIDAPPRILAGTFLQATAVVGSDSGLAHLGGIVGAPTIVLGGSTPVEKIFGCYPRVKCLQGRLACSGCHGAIIDTACPTSCANLQSIGPDRVLAAVDEVFLPTIAAGRTLLCPGKLAVLREQVLATRGLAGDVAELGVYRGGSAAVLAHYADGDRLHLFDTFEGLPATDADGQHSAGEFAAGFEDVAQFLDRPNCFFHVGTFPATARDAYRYRFAHVDGDTYQTTLAACDYFGPRMVPGGVLVFDDYGWWMTPGVARALNERFPGRVGRASEYQAIVRF